MQFRLVFVQPMHWGVIIIIMIMIMIMGRFPFDQKFRNEISSIPCDEWKSIFRLVWTKPSQSITYQFSRENTK